MDIWPVELHSAFGIQYWSSQGRLTFDPAKAHFTNMD